jgi:hypothetical protein
MGREFRHEFRFPHNRFFRRGHSLFVQQFTWPFYWYPYYAEDYYPWDSSYLDYGQDNDYGYGSNSAVPVEPQYSQTKTTPGPLVVLINQGNPGLTEPPHDLRATSSYGSPDAEGKQRIAAQGSSEQSTVPPPPFPGIAAATSQPVQAAPRLSAVGGGKFILLSWLNEDGKDAIFVQNVETSEVQRITSEVNRENFRLVEVHPNADPREFEAIVSNGSERIPVRFRF